MGHQQPQSKVTPGVRKFDQKNDREFEQLPTVERFLFICEELVHDVNSRREKERNQRQTS